MADPIDPLHPMMHLSDSSVMRRRRALVLLVAAGALSCGVLDVTEPGGVAEVRVTPDTVLLRVGDSTLLRAAPLDDDNTLLAQAQPVWTTSASTIATVDSSGLVHGMGSGVVTLTATVGGIEGSAIGIVSGDPAAIAVSTGNGQTAGVNEVVAIAPRVLVTDATGAGVYGVPVTFAVTAGGGALIGTQPAVTDVNGLASIGWRLGPLPGANSITASIAGAGVTGNPVTFTATAVVGPPSAATSTVEASPASIAPSAGNVTSTITVTVRDALGRTVAGAAVSLASTGTGNTLTQPGTVTNNAGQATGTISSTVAGTKIITATVNGSLAIAQQGTVTVNADAPAAIAVVTEPSGAVSNANFLVQPVVEVRDAFGNRLLNGTGAITVSLVAGDGVLASSSGSFTANAVAGRATFAGLHIRGLRTTGDTLGIGSHRLRFTLAGLPTVESATFNVDVSFSYNVNDVFARSCAGVCHNYSTPALINSAPLIGPCVGMQRVVVGDSTSILYAKMKTGPVCGSAMPFGPPISVRQRTIVRDWILQGARTN